MNELPKWVIPAAIGGCVLLFVIIMVSWGISTSNSEVRLRRSIEAKMMDNESELDNMMKKIKQTAQITDRQAEKTLELVTGYAEARGGVKEAGLVSALHEAIPNQDLKTYEKLMAIVTAARDRWTMRQKELIDLKREHDTLRTIFPASMIVGGRPEIKIVVVSSTRAKRSMETGIDDDVELFKN